MNPSAQPGQGDGDAAVFASALRRLFTMAGSPTVRVVAEAVGVSAATVSNWRTGRHLPAAFDTIEPMLVWLTIRAATGAEDVMTIPQWQQLFNTATGHDPAISVLAHIAEAAEGWAADAETADPERLEAARLLLLGCVALSSTGDLTLRTPDIPAATGRVAVELVEIGVLSLTPGDGDTRDEQVQLTDLRLLDTWTRLRTWVRQARPVLISRSALEQDAHRWATAGRPRAWLYDHTRLKFTADALLALSPSRGAAEAKDQTFRFGAATTAHIPSGDVAEFWSASQSASLGTLRAQQIIAAVFIALFVMILGLGLTLGAVTS